MATQRQIVPNSTAAGGAGAVTPFRRMLVVLDDSPSAQAAVGLVAEWVGGPGADVRFVQVAEQRRPRRDEAGSATGPMPAAQAHQLVVGAPTLGARNRQLVRGIAEEAEDFGADVIVLGVDRPRLAGHRLSPGVREQIMRATDLPVLVAPRPQPDGPRHHRLITELDHSEERAPAAHRYVRV
jgi:nucleotide-binding universal stress UspA family protein